MDGGALAAFFGILKHFEAKGIRFAVKNAA